MRVARKALRAGVKCVRLAKRAFAKPKSLVSLVDWAEEMMTGLKAAGAGEGEEEEEEEEDDNQDKGKGKEEEEEEEGGRPRRRAKESKGEYKRQLEAYRAEQKAAKRQAAIDARRVRGRRAQLHPHGHEHQTRHATSTHRHGHVPASPARGTLPAFHRHAARYDPAPGAPATLGANAVRSVPNAYLQMGRERLRDTYRSAHMWVRPALLRTATISTRAAAQDAVLLRAKRTAELNGLPRSVPVLPRTLRCGERVLMVASPAIGPGDVVTLSLYDPADSSAGGVPVPRRARPMALCRHQQQQQQQRRRGRDSGPQSDPPQGLLLPRAQAITAA